MTDDLILQMVRKPSRQEEGFRHLVIKYQQRLYAVIRRQVATHEDADDIMQEVFMKVFRHIGSFEGRSELFTWMYRIAMNETIDHQKKNARFEFVDIGKGEMEHTGFDMDGEDIFHNLELAVKKLPERQQTVFRMRYYEDLSYKEIAELLQLTEGALKASFHHAVRKIKEDLQNKQVF